MTHDGGTADVTLDQSSGSGGAWRYLGSFAMTPANNPKVELFASLSGPVSADAVRFVSGADTSIAYIHSDQVAQPQKMTDATGALIYDRIATPFGETASLTASGGADLALRFPGQQIDQGTGLAYNYFRDYDPSLGRYVQSDPIGLGGSVNTYAYVGANPIGRTDPNGQGFWPVPKLGCAAPDCNSYYQSINTLVNELKKRFYDLIANKLNLLPWGPFSVAGHQQQFRNKQAQLRDLLSEAETMLCLAYHPEAWDWATRLTPAPGLPGRSR